MRKRGRSRSRSSSSSRSPAREKRSIWQRVRGRGDRGASASPRAAEFCGKAAYAALAARAETLRERLERADRRSTGKCSPGALEEAVRKACDLRGAERRGVDRVVAAFVAAAGEAINYTPLLDLLAEVEGKPAGSDALNDAFRKLRKGARRARLSEDRLAAKLGRADDKRAGTVTTKDLERALERLEVSLGRKERDALAKRFAEKRRSRFSSSNVSYAAVARWALADDKAAQKKLAASFEAAPEVARAAARLGREVDAAAWSEFARGAGLPLCDGELRALAAAWDPEGAGAFPVRALQKLGGGSDDASARSSRSRSGSGSESRSRSRSRSPRRAADADAVVAAATRDALRRWVKRRGGGLRKAFRDVDRDGSGVVDAAELRRFVEDASGLDVGRKQLDALLDLMDADGNGRVSYYDFVAFARASGGARESSDAKVLAKLRMRLAKNISRIKPAALDRAFRAQKDADARDATAPPKAIRKALEEELGVKLGKDDEAALQTAFGVGKGRVDFGDVAAWLFVDAKRATKKARRGLKLYERKFGDRRAAFEAVDEKKAGALDARRFREALQNVACVSDAEARCLFDAYDGDGSGSIDYAEFTDLAAKGRLPSPRRSPSPSSASASRGSDSSARGGSDDDDDDDDAVAVLPKPFLRALRRWADEAQLQDRNGLQGVFARYDKAGDGSLDSKKLRKLVEKAVDEVEGDDVDALLALLDADGDGRVSYAEFAAFVGGSSREPAGLDELRASLRKQLRKKRRGGRFSRATPVDVCMVLGARDEEKTGRLERAVFNKTLARAPLSLKFEGGQAATLTRKFRVHEDGVDYVAFAKWLGPDAAGPAAWAFGEKDQRALRRKLRVDADAKESVFSDALSAEALRRAEAKLRTAVELVRAKLGNGSDKALRKALQGALDTDGDGRVSRKELRGALRRFGVPLQPDEENALLDKFDEDGSDDVDTETFVRALCELPAAPDARRTRAEQDNEGGDDGDKRGDVVRRVRRAIRGEDPSKWADAVNDAFRDMDGNGDGEVDGDELTWWLAKELDMALSKGDQRNLVDCLDVDASGTISRDEFLDFAVEPPAGKDIGQVAKRLRKALGEDGLLSLRAELSRADASRDGVLDAEAFWASVRAVAGELGVKPGKLDVRPADRRALEERFCSRGDESKVRHTHILQWLEAGLVDRALQRLRQRLQSLEKRRGNGGTHLDARAVFRKCCSRDGELSRDDLGKACRKCGLTLSPTSLDAAFKALDKDNSGSISWGEFRSELFSARNAEGEPRRSDGGDDPLANTLERIFGAHDGDQNGLLQRSEVKKIAPHALKAFGLQPSVQDLKAFEETLKSAASDGRRALTYRQFEDAALIEVRKALDERARQPQRRAAALDQLRARLGALAGGASTVPRDSFERLCASAAGGGLDADDCRALAECCAAHEGAAALKNPAVDADEVLRLVAAAARGGAAVAAREAAACPFAGRGGDTGRGGDADRVGAAAAKLLRGPRLNDPEGYMLAFGHPRSALPAGFAAPALAAAEREPTHSLGATLAPPALVAGRLPGKSGAVRRVRVQSASAVPAPPRRGAGDDARARRIIRCCLFDAGAGADGVRSNVHVLPATGDGATWAFAPARAATGNSRLRAQLDAYDSAEFLVAADDDAAQLSLLFELATTVPRAYFDGRAADALDTEKKQQRAAAEALGSDYESASDSDYGMDDESAADSGSDDESSKGSRRRRKAGKKANKGDDDDSDRVYSDSDSDASRRKSKKAEKQPRRKKPKARRSAKGSKRPAWFRGRGGPKAAAAKPREPSPAADDYARPSAGGVVEVTCGWAVVPLAELRAATVTVELRGGAPWGEAAFGAAEPASLWRTLTGAVGTPRLTLRVAGAGAAEAAPRGCLVPAPLAPLLGAYATYAEAYLRRHVAATSAHVADPVLSIFRRILSLDAGRRALHALWTVKAAAHARRNPGRRADAANAALQEAVCELWPACEALLATTPGGEADDVDARVVAAARPTLCAPATPAEAIEQAVTLLGEVLDDDEGDGLSPRAGQGLFAPFHTSELVPM